MEICPLYADPIHRDQHGQFFFRVVEIAHELDPLLLVQLGVEDGVWNEQACE